MIKKGSVMYHTPVPKVPGILIRETQIKAIMETTGI